MDEKQFRELIDLLKSSIFLLPFNPTWGYGITAKRSETIPAGGTKLFLSGVGKGWLIGVGLFSTNPDSKLGIKIYSPGFSIPFVFEQSYNNMLLVWEASVVNTLYGTTEWIPATDETYRTYFWHPSHFGYPYNNKLEVYAKNPTTSSVSVSIKIIRVILEGS